MKIDITLLELGLLEGLLTSHIQSMEQGEPYELELVKLQEKFAQYYHDLVEVK
jgi:hypothetical protein